MVIEAAERQFAVPCCPKNSRRLRRSLAGLPYASAESWIRPGSRRMVERANHPVQRRMHGDRVALRLVWNELSPASDQTTTAPVRK